MKTAFLKISIALLLCLNHVDGLSQIQIGNSIYGLSGDNLGFSVSMPDSLTFSVGAPRANGLGGDVGKVFVYRWDGNSWVQKGLALSGTSSGNLFGHSISMPDQNHIAIGAPGSGYTRIYKWTGGFIWTQLGNDILGDSSLDFSGCSVSMPDSLTIGIGAMHNDQNGNNAGQVKVYSWNGSNWVQKGSSILGSSINELSGRVISMPDKNTVAIGAPSNNSNASSSGQVRIFKWLNNDWVQKGNDLNGVEIYEEFGRKLSMPDSNHIAIGCGTTNGRKVNIYRWDGNGWNLKGNSILGIDHEFNVRESISMTDSNTFVCGGKNWGSSNYFGHGVAAMFKWNGNDWYQFGNKIFGEEPSDEFGEAISMSNQNTIVVGAWKNENIAYRAGQVATYTYNGVSGISSRIRNKNKLAVISPNPVNSILNIELTDFLDGDELFKIYDTKGQLKYTNPLSKKLTKIVLSKIPTGLYIIEITSKYKIQREKLYIQ